jgi:hypothetical protein
LRAVRLLDGPRRGLLAAAVNLPEGEQAFLRDLVKASRQRVHVVTWRDRDGTERHTALTQAEATRLDGLARQLGLSKVELMRQAAHIPVAKTRPGGPAAAQANG